MHIDKIERLQVSIRSGPKEETDGDPWIEISSISLVFE
jgi:hypothetical protein